MKKFLNAPVTWGQYLALCAVALACSISAYGVYIGFFDMCYDFIIDTKEKIVEKFKKE